MSLQLTLLLKEQGIQQALDHANQVHEKWAEAAFAKLCQYCQHFENGYYFVGEEFRQWAIERGLPVPPSMRAFGGILLRGAKAGLIAKMGHSVTSNPKAHGCFCTLWQIN